VEGEVWAEGFEIAFVGKMGVLVVNLGVIEVVTEFETVVVVGIATVVAFVVAVAVAAGADAEAGVEFELEDELDFEGSEQKNRSFL